MRVEEEAMKQNLIKFIFNATIVKSMAIMQVNVDKERKTRKVIQSLQKTK